ncbi:MAG: DUF1343 domain-containing protein [Spirosomataceae bacterium]
MDNFSQLAGSENLKKISTGTGEDKIRKSWEPGLSNYKKMREKYLLYP